MSSEFWSRRRVLLTGGGGFLGSWIVEQLRALRPQILLAPRSAELDLLDPQAVREYLSTQQPDLIIHAAATVGGIGANSSSPGRFFYENAVMGIHLIDEARRAGVEKFVCLGTICAYPKFAAVPFRESDIWQGYPEETNAPYGIAKRALLVQLQAYRQEYGFNGIFLLPANLYGPRDNFDLETSHVIPAMIRKFFEAKHHGDRQVDLWGDGTPTRDFLYVEDAARGILAASELYDDGDPVNLARGEEISIAQLAALIAREVGFDGAIGWDRSRPNGQPRRMVDPTRAAEKFGFRATTALAEGIRRTVDWYKPRVNAR